MSNASSNPSLDKTKTQFRIVMYDNCLDLLDSQGLQDRGMSIYESTCRRLFHWFVITKVKRTVINLLNRDRGQCEAG
jgi:hypothetical protein